MSGRWYGLRALAVLLLCVCGCWTTERQLKPKRLPEEYVLPPSDDPRFSNYMTYPKDVMNSDRIKVEKAKDGTGMPGAPTFQRPGSGIGMGGN